MATICRACLISETSLQPINDNFIHGYNTLTNISINTLDGLPQYTCINCLENVTKFLLFRDKCIESENTLQHIFSETVDSKEGIINTDLDIKKELQCKLEIDENNLPEQFDCDSQLDEIKEQKSRKSKPKKKKINTSEKFIKVKHKTIHPIIVKTEGNKKHCCGLCPKEFENRIKLNEHLEFHKNNKECNLCREQFLEWPSLLSHRILHIMKLKGKTCHHCEKRFKCVYKLELHYRSLHYDGEKALSCKYCMKKITGARKLKRHIKSNHVKTQIFQCDHCQKMLASKQGLIIHLGKHSDDKPFKCDLCDFSCKYESGIKAHKIRKHSNTKMSYCKNCGRHFISADLLEKHNCKTRATMCPICGVIKTKRLTEHMTTHHFGGAFKCDLCPSEFKTKSGLKVHQDKHSGYRRYGCEYCSMRFFSASVLIKHKRVHTGEKPYVCKLCNRGFTGNYNLKVHMKVHGEDLVVKRVKNAAPEYEIS